MKIQLMNYRKFKMSKMPFKYYLPRIEKFYCGKVILFTIFRDYGIQLDLR